MKRSLLYLFIFSFSSLFSAFDSFGQTDRVHTVIAETGAFSQTEIEQLSEHFANEMSIALVGGCKTQGLILLEVPVSLGLRIHQAENSILQAISTVWNREATISKQFSRDAVLNCLSEE